MTELTIRELDSIGKHLKKVNEVHKQNNEYENEIDLDLPERIALTRQSNGLALGHIQYSEDLQEHVFIPMGEREAPKWTIPIPPPFN